MTKDEKQADQLVADWRKARVTDRERAILSYAEKLTLTPSNMEKRDVEQLIAAGLSERDVLCAPLSSCEMSIAATMRPCSSWSGAVQA